MIKGCRTLQKVLKDEIGYFNRAVQMKRLEKYAEIIEFVISQYDRKSQDKTMMIIGTRKNKEDTINRRTHQENVGAIASMIAKKKGLNEKITAILGRYHDIGHTFMGHNGERWISNVLENYGLGVVCHNTIGASELIYRHDIYNEIIEKIKLFYPKIPNKELERVKKSLWLIMDGINAHNGEKAVQSFIPEVLKTEEEFTTELTKCFTKKGFDRTIEPASTEACLMRLVDQISYIPYDMADGLREKFITGLDEEYVVEIEKLGITRQEIKQYIVSGKYDDLAKRVQNIFIKDLDENSTKRKIAMSDKIFEIMKNIKKINDRKIVNFVLPDIDLAIYPQAVEGLINIYKDTILQSNLITKISNGKMNIDLIEDYRKKYEGTPEEGMIEYVMNMPKKDYQFIRHITHLAMLEGIASEQEQARQTVIEGKEVIKQQGFEKKYERTKGYISYYESKLEDRTEYTKQEQEGDIKRVVINISKGNYNENYVSNKEGLAIKIGAKYLATLSDREFMQQLLDFGIIEIEDKEKLTMKYKDINLHNRKITDSTWEQVRAGYEEEEVI